MGFYQGYIAIQGVRLSQEEEKRNEKESLFNTQKPKV